MVVVEVKSLYLPRTQTDWWHAHAHSSYSLNDSITPVELMPKMAKAYGMKAAGLTDHGNMGGAVKFYKACMEQGVAPFIGVEAYFMPTFVKDKAPKRWHVILLAYTTEGYKNLVELVSFSHTRHRFHHKPHVTFDDFSDMEAQGKTKGIALLTGCYFGYVQQALVTHDEHEALNRVYDYAQYFDKVYVEIQHHNIFEKDHNDDEIVKQLRWVADTGGFPVFITQDSHYAHQGDKSDHETLKRLGSWATDVDSSIFPGDSYHFAQAGFVESHYGGTSSSTNSRGNGGVVGSVWEAGLRSAADLLAQHNLSIPALDSYSYKIPVVSPDPGVDLEYRCKAKLDALGHGRDSVYLARLKEELDVVQHAQMASYLLLVAEVVQWCHDHDVYVQTRGSAGGSLVCFLAGITTIDPITGDLRYERFLSKDRTKPPDVDLDVSDERRGELLEWLEQRFNVTHIGTYLTHSINEEGKGSLLVAYKQLLRKQGVSDVDSKIQTLADLGESDAQSLRRLSTASPRKAVGTHAAGLVVTTDRGFGSYVPTMLIPSSDTTVTQFDGDDVEAMGYVKLDILGLRNLSLAERCLKMIGKTTKDWSWMNMNDPGVYSMIAKGNTDGVFQLEGYATKLGCKEMKVRNLDDIIIALALYRPATLDTGVKDLYIRRKSAQVQVPTMHLLLEGVLQPTLGLPVFQDQVITILRELGFGAEQLTEFLKAVKASNKDVGAAKKVVEKYKVLFTHTATQHGLSKEDRDWVWQAIEGFSEYGFNKAHATQYAITAYRMAYLKFHYSMEFGSALLQTSAGTPKESRYVVAVRKMGISLLRPDVNISGANWTLDRGANGIRKGLLSIKGVGEKAANTIAQGQPYRDIADLIERTDSRAVTGGKDYEKTHQLGGTLKALYEAGALNSL